MAQCGGQRPVADYPTSSSGMRNWIAEDWDTNAYMAYRDSVVVNVSYYYGFKRLPQAAPTVSSPPKADAAYVAASIVDTALEFRTLLMKGLLEPEPAGKDGGELCSESRAEGESSDEQC